MWISRYRYERLMDRIEALEKAVDVPYTSAPVGKLTRMLMDHFGLHYRRHTPADELVKKGGPERGG